MGLWTKHPLTMNTTHPDPTETAQRLALINYLCAEKKNGVLNPVNLLQIMSCHKMETDDVALIAIPILLQWSHWFQDGVASETALHNIACAVGYRRNGLGLCSGKDETLKANSEGLTKEFKSPWRIAVLAKSFSLRLKEISELDNKQQSPAGWIVSLNEVQ